MTAPTTTTPAALDALAVNLVRRIRERNEGRHAQSRLDYDLIDWIEREPDRRSALAAQVETLTAERTEAHQIVSRIWAMLGGPSYEDLAGQSIYDLIAELQARALAADTARASAEAALAEAHAEAEIQRQDAADNVRLIDAISDLIGQPHDVELRIEHVHLAWGAMREALKAARNELVRHDEEYQHRTRSAVMQSIDAALEQKP